MGHYELTPFPETLLLDGRPVRIEHLCRQIAAAEWEREFLDFVKEWYCPADSIAVQTSGSTGAPKQLLLKKSFVAASAMRTLVRFGLSPGARVLQCLPCRYIAGKLMVVRALLGGLNLVPVPPDTDFRALCGHPFRFAAMTPNQAATAADSGFTDTLEMLLLGGSAIPPPLEHRLQSVNTACYVGYAMTETATHVAIRPVNGPEATQNYRCMDGVSVSRADNGCLTVHLQGLPDGAIKTSDIAEVIDSQTFRIVGRADNVVISGGIKYHPEQLEARISEIMPFPFFICGTPHDTLGQQLVLVAEAPETPENETLVRQLCASRLSRYERPKQIRFVHRLPRTDTGKVLRKL
ncbi:MAG: AMP-binding protein [Bacteroidales bacterium]|nr:AMP-binding protein [Bacteroidales bacterium]